MKMTQHFPATLHDVAEDLTKAHALLLKGGFIRQIAPGIYALMPLGWRVLKKINNIIFDEMENEGVHNLQLPILQPRELWEKTGRWQAYIDSKTMFVTKERFSGAEFGLAPTAEEIITFLAASEIKSWRDLPLSLHQIGWKFRDEMRTRFGLLRGREFCMSDAYSFDRDKEGMEKSFHKFREIYQRIFDRVGLNEAIAVHADPGAIGGTGSAEFMVLSKDVGEDILLTCDSCDYGANIEKAGSVIEQAEYEESEGEMEKVHTPGAATIEQLEQFFSDRNLTPQHILKTIIITVDPDSKEPYQVAVCIRGDLDVNETKVRNALGATEVAPAEPVDIEKATGAPVGFAGPINLTNVKRVIFDNSTKKMINFLCGINEKDYHALNVNFGKDVYEPDEYFDLHTAKAGDGCPVCDKGILTEKRGIEIGHVFMLQQGYAKAMNVEFDDEKGEKHTPWMGCYGIGTTRLIQAVADQNNDEHGIIWPESVAPYKLMIVVVNWSNETQQKLGIQLHERAREAGIETMLDDRNELNAGAKFIDADLLGFPWRATVGRKAAQKIVELRNRLTGEVEEFMIDEVIERLK